jgi:hypothetical protein
MTHVFLLLCLLAGDLQYQDSLLLNPSFEEDGDRDTHPDGWEPHAFDSPARLEWDDSVSRSGRRSLKVSDSFRVGDQRDWKRCTGRWVSVQRPIEVGTEYKLEVWVKTEGVSGQVYAHLAWQRGTKWLNEITTERVSGTSDWQKLTVSAVAPAEADTVIVSMNLSRSKGTAWFDDVSLSGKSDVLPEVKYVFNDTGDWFPFESPDDDINLDAIDLTSLLDAPAGKRGFVGVRPDGHFYFQDGSRARFFGTNLGGADVAPPKEQSRVLAARFAKYGANMIRLHSIDGSYTGVIDYARGNSRHFVPEALDRMDYLIAELKKHGIYIYLDLLDYRMFRDADGVKEGDQFTHNWAGSMKGASIFDERMIELQKEFATKLLTHRNPYTGLRYVDDPAIAVVETTNENGVFYFLLNGDLSRPYYREQLRLRWNGWLKSRYGDHAKLTLAWSANDVGSELTAEENLDKDTIELPQAEFTRFSKGFMSDRNKYLWGPARMRDALQFLGEIQEDYYLQMRSHLKETVGVRVPITGTNQMFLLRDTEINARMSDFVSRNQYWRHPSVHAQPFMRFSNMPMVRSDLTTRTPLSVFGGSSVVGKPLALAEFNFPWPNEYRCEGLLLATAYACLQDWDAVLLFSFKPSDPMLQTFRSQSDPARWGEFPAAALMFHRHDVSTARNEVHVVHTQPSVSNPQPDERYARYTNFRYLTFLSKARHAFIDDSYRGNASVVLATGASVDAKVEKPTKVIRIQGNPAEEWLYPKFVTAAQRMKLPGYVQPVDAETKRFVSDTGELSLDYERGLMTINTPQTKSVIGYLADAGNLDLNAMTVDCETEFATITANSLDGEPIGRSRHLLLTCVGRAENTAQAFWPAPPNPNSWSPFTTWQIPARGRRPVIVEPIRAKVSLAVPGMAEAHALDSTGKRQTALAVTYADGIVTLDPATARSIWCEIVVE